MYLTCTTKNSATSFKWQQNADHFKVKSQSLRTIIAALIANLDVFGALKQSSVEYACFHHLTEFHLKVNVALPQHLRHVELRLVDGQLVDSSSAVVVA
jgi:hypothetical protein